MNTRIALSGLSIFAALSLMTGGAFAFFSSSATSTGNVFAAGTLNLLVDDNDQTDAATVAASFGDGITPLVPGGTQSGFVSLHNTGSTAIAEVNLAAAETATSSPDLATKLTITSAKIDTNQTCTASPVDVTASLPGAHHLSDLNGANVDLPSSSIAVSNTKYLCMTFTLDSGTDNTFQGKSITDTFTLTAHQDLSQ